MILGRNRAEDREPWPDDVPSLRTIRRKLADARGETIDLDSPVSDAEYRECLAQVKGGRRGG